MRLQRVHQPRHHRQARWLRVSPCPVTCGLLAINIPRILPVESFASKFPITILPTHLLWATRQLPSISSPISRRPCKSALVKIITSGRSNTWPARMTPLNRHTWRSSLMALLSHQARPVKVKTRQSFDFPFIGSFTAAFSCPTSLTVEFTSMEYLGVTWRLEKVLVTLGVGTKLRIFVFNN